MKHLIFFLALLTVGVVQAQNKPCACCTEAHVQFDFWVGDWIVYDTTGVQVGENTIVKLENGCILSEHWRGAKGTTGRSYNYFNAQDSSWNQTWVDNSGGSLVLKGKASKNQMVMKSELQPGKKVDFYYNQISWTKNQDGSVTQIWDIFSKEGAFLARLFKGIYKKKE